MVCLAVHSSAYTGDEFDFFNSSKWIVEVTGSPYNNELQYYTDRYDNYHVEDGHLVIKPLKENYEGRQYTSSRMHSRFTWKYGRVEVRAKLPNGHGLWPAIWMMSKDEVYGGWPQSGEIDIMEARGQNLDEFASTIHYGICCDQKFQESSGDMKLQCSIDEYHVYSLDWTPTQLVYRLDGKAYYTQDIDRKISYMYSENGQPFDQEFYVILNVAIGGDYLDNPKPETVWEYPDAEMWVDYVRVTPLEEITSSKCVAKDDADINALCGSANWACTSQNFADVSSQCTEEFYSCCSNPASCDNVTELVSAIYTEYDRQVHEDDSCNFGGTAHKEYALKDSDVDVGDCVINDGADAQSICYSLEWACGGQTYADVSKECGEASDILSCCSSNAYACNYDRLVKGSSNVFQKYYSTIPSPSSCDFGGVAHVENSLFPLKCIDGFGA